ncbi:MAG: MBL fold metallo-hydrolase [Lautropia sp.]|nr:MBL fold metallo-hydrolase [Lautropia sp.]
MNKTFPLILAAALVAGGCASPTQTAHSAPPQIQAQRQVTGFYRHQTGNLTVTALFDGIVHVPRTQMQGIAPERVADLVRQAYSPEHEKGLDTAVNAFVVQRGSETILVDAGTAQCFSESNPQVPSNLQNNGLGQLSANLKAAGIRPERIDHILLTHGHSDHICGAIDQQGKPVFPNAVMWISDTEYRHWYSDETRSALLPELRFLTDQIRTAMAPYERTGRLKRFKAGDELPAGAQALATPGHTPGHVSYLFETGREKLLVWGDVLITPAVQFAEPQALFAADEDKETAKRSRLDMLRQAAENGWTVAGAHLSFPALGHVGKGRGRTEQYRWIPVEYAP